MLPLLNVMIGENFYSVYSMSELGQALEESESEKVRAWLCEEVLKHWPKGSTYHHKNMPKLPTFGYNIPALQLCSSIE
ncbi:Protein of unknown function [Pyronema omphalodes CBS 100304]|uniref:Uncharacterized protein n=1 Tax=Pyronema omphalodes (strain CBS 100304) TaxID=1076935 RepID=U4LGN4_PYROM|nr:Protein of unknown function [Pyronema omphalodes CBS 100304]